MFEKGDNQISTARSWPCRSSSSFVLVVLLLWSLIGGSKADSTPCRNAAADSNRHGRGDHRRDRAESESACATLLTSRGNSAYDGFRIVMVEQPSDTVAQGVVISQDPPADTEKLMDDQIIRSRSAAARAMEMPDIIGFTQANASKKAGRAGHPVQDGHGG